MPPKPRITEEMIVEAGLEIVREAGFETINARAVAAKLNCSTQPVMYHFETIEELKHAIYGRADEYHTSYLMNIEGDRDVMMRIGLNYLGFAVHEPNLFRFLFQSGYAKGNSFPEMIDAPELLPVLEAMRQEMNIDLKQVKQVFFVLALFVHGYASMIANNGLEYDEKTVQTQLEQVYKGALWAAMENENEK